MRGLKKLVCLLVCISLISVLISCMNPLHYEMMPDKHPGSTYYCEGFDIEFTVHDEDFLVYKEDGAMDHHSNITGKIIVDGVEYEFYASFSVDCGMEFLSKEISNEGVIDASSFKTIKSKHCLVSATCHYKLDGDIVATVEGGTLLKPGTELTFRKKQ